LIAKVFSDIYKRHIKDYIIPMNVIIRIIF
jgi:hypothetical protein